jgi:hypothetical protein
MRARSILALAAALSVPALHAQAAPSSTWEPLFLGYGTEPEMDFGGRTVMSLHSLISRSFSRIGDAGERHPALAPAWEFPVGAAMLLIQHEVGGHGGRARELGLSPSYSFGYDFSAATGTARPPDTNEGNALLAAGGVEADGVMAHRTLLDLLRPEGADGAKVPLAMMAKLDLTLYVSSAEDPDEGEDLVEQYRDGNDIAYYLLSRQAQRHGADPTEIWNGTYQADLSDPLLHSTWEDARTTALWNLLDPLLVGAVVNYFREHVLGGSVRVHAPVLRISEGLGLTLGTRGALGPQEVSRFLDLHAATRRGVFTVYVRDLDSSIDRTYGFGAGVHGFRLGTLAVGLAADAWDEPDSLERRTDDRGWNANAEVDTLLGERWGLALKVGSKSDGFFPGLPLDDGAYFAFGVRAAL